jgi:phospholipase/lecithinase/hemolysin
MFTDLGVIPMDRFGSSILAGSMGATLLDMAYGGATTSSDNPAAGLPKTGLQWQVATYGAVFSSIPDDTLVTVWAGGNDMFNARDPITAADNIATAITTLIGLGGDTFLVPNLTKGGAYADWINSFDTALESELAGLRTLYPNKEFFYLDLNNLVLTGIDYYDGTFLAQTYGSGVYAWWDQVGVHPTTEVHCQIAAYALNTVPEPGVFVYLLVGLATLAALRKRGLALKKSS